MATDFTPRDGAGREMDYEQYRSLLEREAEELRVERYPTFNQNITLLAVMDSSGNMQGMIALPSHALNETHEAYILGEVRKLRPETPGPDIRLVG